MNKEKTRRSTVVNRMLHQEINDCLTMQKPISEKLAYELMTAERKDLDWDLFYDVLDIPGEAESGYWNATTIASTLLMPIIKSTFLSNKNGRINEEIEEDFLSEARLAIQECIPSFDRDTSHFPNYVKVYISHVGYVHNKDSSPYLQKVRGIRVFSQQAFAEQNNVNEEFHNADAYSQVNSGFCVEDEFEKREKQKSSNIFSALVVNRKAFGEDSLSEHKNALIAKAKKEKLIQQTTKIIKAVEKGENIQVNGEDITKENLKDLVMDKAKRDVAKYDKIIETDFNQTIINASYYQMFLGGFSSFPDVVKESVYRGIGDRELGE